MKRVTKVKKTQKCIAAIFAIITLKYCLDVCVYYKLKTGRGRNQFALYQSFL